ncbi:MAG: penicillin-binding protein 2 [Armatimonadetes bacterium]|nr:penicillin-binding protein 2 [Armatimonadota bacterium]
MRLARAIPRLMTLYAAGFAAVVVQVGYWQLVRGNELRANPNNRRSVMNLRRGRILAADGAELAKDARVAGDSNALQPRYQRVYPQGEEYAHLTGYSSVKYRQAGLEAALNRWLLGLEARPPEPRNLQQVLDRLARGPVRIGCDVTLSVIPAVQDSARRALDRRDGAIVALDVRTGAVLAMVDWPTYDPNRIDDDWTRLQTSAKPLLARAYQEYYPPGSVFKPVTAATALDTGSAAPETSFDCQGTKVLAHTRVKCFNLNGHGPLTLFDGVAKSCNIVLAETALRIGPLKFENSVAGTGLGEAPRLFRPGADPGGVVKGGAFPRGDKLTPAELAACGYGQGGLQVTPLYVATEGQMLGNGGVAMAPWLVSRITGPDGAVLYQHPAESGRQAFSAATAAEVLKMMRAVMRPGGTAAHLGLDGVDVCGKTGSAQHETGKPPHSWFLAVAPAEAPRVAVAAVVENGGYGGRVAGPAAMRVLRVALEATR